jgi:hypothetical protein
MWRNHSRDFGKELVRRCRDERRKKAMAALESPSPDDFEPCCHSTVSRICPWPQPGPVGFL